MDKKPDRARKKRRPHRKLPDLNYLLDKYEYDPILGGLFKKGEEHIEQFALGHWLPSGHKAINILGKPWMLHRICFYMYHRRDPKHYVIDHINGDPADNRIHNLRCCRPKANAKNLRKKGKYVVDDEGVGRWVSGVVTKNPHSLASPE